jgi:hypothetical protein
MDLALTVFMLFINGLCSCFGFIFVSAQKEKKTAVKAYWEFDITVMPSEFEGSFSCCSAISTLTEI